MCADNLQKLIRFVIEGVLDLLGHTYSLKLLSTYGISVLKYVKRRLKVIIFVKQVYSFTTSSLFFFREILTAFHFVINIF